MMIIRNHIIILKELKSSPLEKIQFYLGEHKLKGLIVSEHIYMNTIQAVSLDLEWKQPLLQARGHELDSFPHAP